MRKKTQVLLFIALGIAAFITPLGLSLYIAWNDGRTEATRYLEQLTSDILRRSAATRTQIDTALDTLSKTPAQDPCSPEQLRRMRAIAGGAKYLQGMGYIKDDHLLCSSLTQLDEPIALGKPQRLTSTGFTYWGLVNLPDVSGGPFNINARNGYATILDPDLVVDILPEQSPISLVQINTESGGILRSRGEFRKEWLADYHGQKQIFSDDNHFVVILPASNQETTAIAAMPHSQLISDIRDAAVHVVPYGLIISVLLTALTYFIARYRLSLKAQLQSALKRREFFLLYQPVIDLRSNRCVGAEALIRWRHPNGELVSPVIFIPAAERHGLIQQVTAQVMEMVAHDTTELITNNPETHIAINFSAEDLHSVKIAERLQTLIKSTGGTSRNILIEATERGFMSPDKAKGVLFSVRSQGFKVAIDDFGTGNSSLSYLATYDLDFLKIDKMFVDSLGSDTASSRVAFHIIEMARTLNLQMIAEGVETEEQRDILRNAGVQFAQGWVFGKPMPIAELTEFIHQRNSVNPELSPSEVTAPQ